MRWDNLVGEVSSEDGNDTIYELVVESEYNVDNDADLMVEDNAIFSDLEKEVDEADTSDEEYRTTRDRVRGCNNKLIELAQQL